MDPENALAAIDSTSNAITKFQEIVLKILGPRWTRKQADADIYANERLLALIRDNPDMDITITNGKMTARLKVPANEARALQRTMHESLQQENNLEAILGVAATEVASADNISDQPVDDDWLSHFTNYAKNVTTNEMQLIWGKILAGEINNPGSFSMRTLDKLHSLSKKDAECFQKILPIILLLGNGGFTVSDSEIYSKYGISFSEIMWLDECGLITSNGLVSFTPTIASHSEQLIYTNNRLIRIFNPNTQSKKLSIGIHTLTQAGAELFHLLSAEPNNDYIIDVAQMISKTNSNLNLAISVHTVKKIFSDTVVYDKSPIAEF